MVNQIKTLPREVYDNYIENLDYDGCLLCEYSTKQIVIKEWNSWVLIQPLSPYFKKHSMLCSKRHIISLKELNSRERDEYWEAYDWILNKYKINGVNKVRSLINFRFGDNKDKIALEKIREHLHISFFEFENKDFQILISENAYKENMVEFFN